MKPSGFASCRDSGASCTAGVLHAALAALHSPPDDEALLCNMKQLRYEALALLAWWENYENLRFIWDFHIRVLYDSFPPFFENSLKSDDTKSSLARHNDQLSWTDLAESVDNLLSSDGTFSVILPIDGYERLIENLYIKGFKECRSCKILTKEGKPCKRILAAFTKDLARSPSTEQQTLLTPDGQRTEWYELLTKNFYIR